MLSTVGSGAITIDLERERPLTVSLPRTTVETPRRPCEAITIKSHFLRLGGFDNRLIDLFMLDVERLANNAGQLCSIRNDAKHFFRREAVFLGG